MLLFIAFESHGPVSGRSQKAYRIQLESRTLSRPDFTDFLTDSGVYLGAQLAQFSLILLGPILDPIFERIFGWLMVTVAACRSSGWGGDSLQEIPLADLLASKSGTPSGRLRLARRISNDIR